MKIDRKRDRIIVDGPAEYFTGKATIRGQFSREDEKSVRAELVEALPAFLGSTKKESSTSTSSA